MIASVCTQAQTKTIKNILQEPAYFLFLFNFSSTFLLFCTFVFFFDFFFFSLFYIILCWFLPCLNVSVKAVLKKKKGRRRYINILLNKFISQCQASFRYLLNTVYVEGRTAALFPFIIMTGRSLQYHIKSIKTST